MKNLFPIVLISLLVVSCDEDSPVGFQNPDGYLFLCGMFHSIELSTYIDEIGCSGSIPPEIGNLINLEQLNMTDGNVTGEIPSSIGNLTNLTYLNLTNNDLTGEVPSEIGNLINLEELRLNQNQLTGEIPPEIESLINLER